MVNPAKETLGNGYEKVYFYHKPSALNTRTGISSIRIGSTRRQPWQRVWHRHRFDAEQPVIMFQYRCDDAARLKRALLDHLRAKGVPEVERETFQASMVALKAALFEVLGVPVSAPIGEQIRYHRRARKWSQDMLAKASGVSQDNIWRVETGQSCLTSSILKLAAALDMKLVLAPI